MRARRGFWLALGLSAVLLAATSLGASASGIYPSATTGYDVSYPDCGAALPSGGAFGIVGATGGRAYTANSCFATELAWAAALPNPASAYMNLNYPVGSTASNGATGPDGTCTHRDKACVAYNYGYNAAAYAAGLVPSGTTISTWWLDIETSNSWSKNTALNLDVIDGAIYYWQTHNATVGIYSTAGMWKTITGSAQITGSSQQVVPDWVAGGSATAPSALCSASFSGGPVQLVQYASNGFDGDYGC
ncbi:MAG TPA: hypothetical protein VFN57_15770 [Thermomicrobiaceae bacterium]|nr:hypothetical protein [Thermomicrobiaceae bacterium]